MTGSETKNSPIESRWAIIAIYLGFIVGFVSAVICLRWQLIIFGFNIMYIVSPLLAGVVESYIALKKYGRSTGAISALLTFILINLYGWVLPGWIFPKEPATLSLITIIALALTIQAAFPIFVNHLLFVVVPGIASKIIGLLVKTPSEIIQATSPETEGKEGIIRQADEIFLDELGIPLVSVPGLKGEKIVRYLGFVAGDALAEEEESEGRFSNILKIIQPMQLDDMNLGEAKKAALSRMLEKAESMGANAVVEVLIDYISMGGLQGSVTIITATGTAVVVEGGTSSDVIQEKTSNLDEKPSAEEKISAEYSKPKISVKNSVKNHSKVNDAVYGGDGSSFEGYEKIKTVKETAGEEPISEIELSSKDSSRIYPINEKRDWLSKDLELATKNEFDEELKNRFLKASLDLDVSKDVKKPTDFDKFNDNFIVDKKINDRRKPNEMDFNSKLFKKSDFGGRIMRIKEEIIGKEVVDVNAMVIGKVQDVEVNFETKRLEAFIIGTGGILESLGSSKGDLIIPESMVMAIGDKILVKTETLSE